VEKTMTNDANYCYFIRSDWKRRPEPISAISAKFVETLDALSAIYPMFADWEIFDARNMASFFLASARSRVAAVIENNVVRDDFGQPLPNCGYHASARAGIFKDPRSVRFRFDAGGQYEGGTSLQFADFDIPPDPEIVTYPLLKSALLAINAIWQAPWACVTAFRSDVVKVPIQLGALQATRIDSPLQVPSDDSFPYSIFHIPWIAYLSAPLAANVRLAPEVLTERTPDGGLLMIVTEERLDLTKPEHRRGARILAETLIGATGYSSTS
jgi:hypothetical protein